MQASDRGVRVSKFEDRRSIGKFMWLNEWTFGELATKKFVDVQLQGKDEQVVKKGRMCVDLTTKWMGSWAKHAWIAKRIHWIIDKKMNLRMIVWERIDDSVRPELNVDISMRRT